MKKSESKEPQKCADERRKKRNCSRALKTASLLSIAVLLVSLLVFPASALGTGTDDLPSVGRRLYPAINGLTLYETYANKNDPYTRYSYLNNIDLPIWDDPDQLEWETSIQYSVDGDRQATRAVVYNHYARTSTATYERYNANTLTYFGTLPIQAISSQPEYAFILAEYSSGDILHEADGAHDELVLRYLLGSTTSYNFLTNGFRDQMRIELEYEYLRGEEWYHEVAHYYRPIKPYTTCDGSSTYAVEVDLGEEFDNALVRNFSVRFLSQIWPGGNDPSEVHVFLTPPELVERGIINTGWSVTMRYSESPKTYGDDIVHVGYIDDDWNPFNWISNVVDSFLNIQLFTTLGGAIPFTIGSALAIAITAMFVIVVLKFFYGG